MAQAASTFDDAPVERKPGEFRRSKTGTPYVVDPTGATTKNGTPKLLAYGRPSGFGKQIEDMYNLVKWSERQGVLGIGIDYAEACAAMAQPELATACAALVPLDPESPEFRNAADAVIVEAKRIAKTGIAAERGTHGHALTEDHDTEQDWVKRAEAGEVLGLDLGVQAQLVAAWRRMLDANGLEVLATEFAMVHDQWRMAGTADRIARLTKPLRFSLVTGEVVELPADTVVVLDIKTGRLRTDRQGVAMYWQAYAVQIATYAGGVLYDPDTDTRTAYPWPVSQRWGLIAHLDVLGALAGAPTCNLVLVDLDAGRHAAELCLAAKAWEKRNDVFSIAQLDAAPQAVADATSAPGVDGVPVAVDAGALSDPSVVASCDVIAEEPTMAELHDRLRRHPDIDEGFEVRDEIFARMAEHWIALSPERKSWAANLQTQAKQHGCGFHASEKHTIRRYELIRGLIVLAIAELDDDELVRLVVFAVTQDETATLPAIEPGHALGALNAPEATQFAQLCDQLAGNQVVLTFTEAGKPQFVAAA